MTGSPIFSVNFTSRENPTKLSKLSYYVEIMNQPFMGFLYHVLVGRESFDVRDYFHDLFVGGKFYLFFPLDAPFCV